MVACADRAPLAGPALASLAVIGGSLALQRPAYYESPVRFDFEDYARLHDYRKSFAGLVAELSSDRYHDARVLGTLDHQAYVYWTTFQQRFVLAADPFASTADDEENEQRPRACSGSWAPRGEEVGKMLDQLLADRALPRPREVHDLAALPHRADPRVRRPCPAADRAGAHALELEGRAPVEREGPPPRRLRPASAVETRFAPPDVIVLTANETARGLAPSAEAYEPTYEDAVFKVWKRR